MCFHCKKCGKPVGPEDRQAAGSNDYCLACHALLRIQPAKEKKTDQPKEHQ